MVFLKYNFNRLIVLRTYSRTDRDISERSVANTLEPCPEDVFHGLGTAKLPPFLSRPYNLAEFVQPKDATSSLLTIKQRHTPSGTARHVPDSAGMRYRRCVRIRHRMPVISVPRLTGQGRTIRDYRFMPLTGQAMLDYIATRSGAGLETMRCNVVPGPV